MKKIIVYLILCLSFNSFSQTDNIPTPEAQEEPLTIAEEMPEFPGGMQELYKFISKNIVFPISCMEDKHFLSCKVFVKFIVTTEGEAIKPVVVKGCTGYTDCDKEAVRVINIMPRWTPGKMNGKQVAVYYTLPIKFTR